MARRATQINMTDRWLVIAGEPMLDTSEGVLIIQYDDGTSRTINWDKVIDFYYMTEEEYDRYRAERGLQEEEDEDDDDN
ncbi:hypothetical protein SEA_CHARGERPOWER_47 [Mycobacterium phage Chargerpower]|nr:hypothetical protein SEA_CHARGERPOWER_47 [Mycobacterium phage Chargerpower]